ncbi:ABC transporter substrate-binding protein [Chelatococcus sp. GCM10030263]|uniref:ABC transporter substrate-binding protein n=1 Tax=Chelatococcus sp. GCM10030263 TaxID=3273387 RepID=UPI003619E9B9
MKRSISTVVAAVLAMVFAAGTAAAEADKLRIAKQYGLGYVQLMIMEEQKLIEKHAKAAGLGDITVEWSTFRSSDVMNDALISGNLDFASLGPTGIITIWSKTRGNFDVRAASGLNAMAWMLNVRDPRIKSIRDFTDNDRIAVPAVKVSGQATALEMAAAKEWGDENYDKLDHLTVSLAHPDATAMMLAGESEIVANFSSPPYEFIQLKDPKIRTILTSDEILGGPISFNVIATTGEFRKDNPKLYKAFLDALDEATALINKDKAWAADVYGRMSRDKTPKEEILAIMNHPTSHFTTEVLNLGAFTTFLGKVGRLKNPPKDWKTEMLFPEAKAR